MADAADTVAGEEVRPYKIHVSSKYLNLTRQKLEITRLPHEGSAPKSDDWWEPKPHVEPLIDHWLEKYSWRAQEDALNSSLPQFRAAVSIASSESPIRLHFVHVRSPHASAVPLLLIPPFPFTNLSFGHLVKPLTDPDNVQDAQPFHLVIPSLPGLGFSDPLPNNTPPIFAVADMLDTLMVRRLGYTHYIASNAGAAALSPARIDWTLAHALATHYPDSCVGMNLIAPPLKAPRVQDDPWEWTKWTVASLLHAGILGYSGEDFAALKRNANSHPHPLPPNEAAAKKAKTPTQLGLNKFGLQEPNTIAYALCDSPTGLLVFVLKGLRVLGPKVQFSKDEILNFTELAWLPGPEYAMRFWAHCAQHPDADPTSLSAHKKPGPKRRPRVAITVFAGSKDPAVVVPGGSVIVEAETEAQLPKLSAREHEEGAYACPAWGNAYYDVVHTTRAEGRPGLLAWERPEIIVDGIRALGKEIMRLDARLKPGTPEPTVAPLEKVVVKDDVSPGAGPGARLPTVPEASGEEPPAEASEKGKGKEVAEEPSEATGKRKGKEKELDLEPPAPIKEPFSDGESPDTLVVNTPPLEV